MVPEKVSVLGIKCKFIVFCSVSEQISVNSSICLNVYKYVQVEGKFKLS